MKPIQITDLSEEQLNELAELYRTTHDVRLRTRAQMVLLAEEQSFTVAAIATIVRESEGTVRCWLKRYQAEGIEGLRASGGWRRSCEGEQGIPRTVAARGAAETS